MLYHQAFSVQFITFLLERTSILLSENHVVYGATHKFRRVNEIQNRLRKSLINSETFP